ncbi:MAG: protein phosphatase CheZ, partial [Proteobacteria bacterium]|nr:protein phosphatase CheZ [Pseudomonadota bacterium]
MSIETQLVESLTHFLERVSEDSDTFQIAHGLLEQLQHFIQNMNDVDPDEMQQLVREWEAQPDLFKEIGKIVRTLYDQMKTINSDIPNRLGEIANHDMEDASERLRHIVEMTEAAANKTMDLAEDILNRLSDKKASYDDTLKQIESALEIEGLPPVAAEALKAARSSVQQETVDSDLYQQQLTDILLAQDYQDLTGQVINRIVTLMTSLEQEL